jgi:ATP-dependent RNA helicase DDX35
MLDYRALKRATEIRAQLHSYLKRFAEEGCPLASCGEDDVALRRCVVSGYFAHAARMHADGVYRTVRDGRAVVLHPSSVLHKFGVPPAWLVYHDVQLTSQEFIREVSKISPKWLVEQAPHFYALKDAVQGGDSGKVGLPGASGANKRRKKGAARPKKAQAMPMHRLVNAIGKTKGGLRSQF